MSLLMIPLTVGCGDGDATKGDSTHDAVADTDVDGDGVAAEVDCDDNDPESTTVSIDGDCDGVLAEDDCDDSDSESTAVSVDGDCDGVLTDDDCDDEDASVSLCWKTIEAGRYHTCGITTADEVLCWGDDEFGQATPPQGIVFSSLRRALWSAGATMKAARVPRPMACVLPPSPWGTTTDAASQPTVMWRAGDKTATARPNPQTCRRRSTIRFRAFMPAAPSPAVSPLVAADVSCAGGSLTGMRQLRRACTARTASRTTPT